MKKNTDVFGLITPGIIRLPPCFERLRRQGGVFSVCPTPTQKFVQGVKKEIVIRNTLKDDFLSKLHNMGVTAETLFPGLDGLCQFAAWKEGFKS